METKGWAYRSARKVVADGKECQGAGLDKAAWDRLIQNRPNGADTSPGKLRNKMPRPSNREQILDAAEKVAVDSGAAHLTLDAVAAAAKVSKGGLLYHFKDKDAMLAALVERYMVRCNDKRMEDFHAMGGDASAQLKSQITTICDDKGMPRGLHQTLLIACANTPAMMDPLRKVAQLNMDNIRKNFKHPEQALTLLLAAHGLRFLDLLQFQPFSVEERKTVMRYLLDTSDALATGGRSTLDGYTGMTKPSFKSARK
ncbi:MAG: TetR family transcriptional regulator [Proteobacteria bacterium]|nr:TetR family transcriptional regulator [Pseudomonadota bacterium]